MKITITRFNDLIRRIAQLRKSKYHGLYIIHFAGGTIDHAIKKEDFEVRLDRLQTKKNIDKILTQIQ